MSLVIVFRIWLCCFLISFCQLTFAVETVSGLDDELVGADTIDLMLAANPPLSYFDYDPGLRKFTVQPSYYNGTQDFGLGGRDFSGGALAFDYTRVVTSRWGWYVSGLYMRYRSDHSFTDFLTDSFLNNVKIDYITIRPGIHYLLTKNEGYRPTVVAMAGPYLKINRFSQSYLVEGGALNADFPNQTIYDFDVKANPFLLGFTVGGKLSWRIKDRFAINAFGFLQIPFTDTCRPYSITELRTDLPGNSTEGLCSGEGRSGVNFKGIENIFGQANNLSGGFNIEYIPWQVAINISAPIIKYFTKEYTSSDITLISLSKSFGGAPLETGQKEL